MGLHGRGGPSPAGRSPIGRIPAHYGDASVAAAVRAGDLVFLAHHTGDIGVPSYVHQTRTALEALERTLIAAGTTRDHVVSLTMWVRAYTDEQRAAWDVIGEFFGEHAPARMTATTDFFDAACLVQVEGVAFVG